MRRVFPAGGRLAVQSGMSRFATALAGAASVAMFGCATAELTPDGGRSADADGGDAASAVDAACVPPPSPQMFEFSGQIEMFQVPECVESITIEAFGAQGGNGQVAGSPGGMGAHVRGSLAVVPGDMLTILVGEKGADGVPFATRNGQGGGCGGGGSFVVVGVSPVIVAGGGGGASANDNPQVNIALAGGDALIIEDGQAGDGGGAGLGGTAGSGGVSGSNAGGFHVGTAGAGFLGDGQGASNGSGGFGTPNAPGLAFVNGGAGGVPGSQGRAGGFGGGGAAGFTGGGGGGYSGGGTGSIFGTYGGGGGGSLNMASEPLIEAGIREGNGAVIISW